VGGKMEWRRLEMQSSNFHVDVSREQVALAER